MWICETCHPWCVHSLGAKFVTCERCGQHYAAHYYVEPCEHDRTAAPADDELPRADR